MSIYLKLTNSQAKNIKPSPNTPSPKSVSSYLKDLKSNDKKNKLLYKENEDPTDLKNILNVLKSSKTNYVPHEEDSIDNSKQEIDERNVCELKYFGDISHISFSAENENSFRLVESSSSDEENENKLISAPAKSSIEEEENEIELFINQTVNSRNMEILMAQLNIEREREQEIQVAVLKRRENYLDSLTKIRNNAVNSFVIDHQKEIDKRISEDKKIKQMKLDAIKETEQIEQNYIKECKEKKALLMKEVDTVCSENAAYIKSLKEQLIDIHNKLNENFTPIANVDYLGDEKCEKVLKYIKENLPKLMSSNQTIISPNFESKNLEQLLLANIDISRQMMTCLLSLLQGIAALAEVQKQESTQPQPEPQHQHQPESLPTYNEAQTVNETKITPEIHNPTVVDSMDKLSPHEKKYFELKNKFTTLLTEANKLKDNVELRPLLARTVGIVNQLNNTKHDSSNRGKLQQLMNLISGRICTLGTNSVTTKDNPQALAFVKEQLSTKLVSLSHDIQVSTMSIYASLIVRLWQYYPDLGEFILFKLFETCPYLVPLTIKKGQNQSEEEYNRALGFKHKEGGEREPIDKFLTRIGNAAQLYARIICTNIDDHPHGIEEGWCLIARILSDPPYPSITASLLNGLLTIAGNALLLKYNKQFKKLLNFICVSYLPLMEKESLEGGLSDLTSLKILLQNYLETGNIPSPPEGYNLLI